MSGEQEPASRFSIDLAGRSADELELHEQLTVYLDAMRIFKAVKLSAGAYKTKIRHTDFYEETGVTYNAFLQYVRDTSNTVERPPFKAPGPLYLQIAEAAIMPVAAIQMVEGYKANHGTEPPLAKLPELIGKAIEYVQSVPAADLEKPADP